MFFNSTRPPGNTVLQSSRAAAAAEVSPPANQDSVDTQLQSIVDYYNTYKVHLELQSNVLIIKSFCTIMTAYLDPLNSLKDPSEILSKIKELVICPISLLPMSKPVTLEDGHTYDQKNIDRWFSLRHQTSPLTNQDLTNKTYNFNELLEGLINKLNSNGIIELPLPPSCEELFTEIQDVFDHFTNNHWVDEADWLLRKKTLESLFSQLPEPLKTVQQKFSAIGSRGDQYTACYSIYPIYEESFYDSNTNTHYSSLLDKQGNLRGILKPQPKGLYLQDSQSSGHDSYGVYKRFIRFLSIYHNLVSEGPCPHPPLQPMPIPATRRVLLPPEPPEELKDIKVRALNSSRPAAIYIQKVAVGKLQREKNHEIFVTINRLWKDAQGFCEQNQFSQAIDAYNKIVELGNEYSIGS